LKNEENAVLDWNFICCKLCRRGNLKRDKSLLVREGGGEEFSGADVIILLGFVRRMILGGFKKRKGSSGGGRLDCAISC